MQRVGIVCVSEQKTLGAHDVHRNCNSRIKKTLPNGEAEKVHVHPERIVEHEAGQEDEQEHLVIDPAPLREALREVIVALEPGGADPAEDAKNEHNAGEGQDQDVARREVEDDDAEGLGEPREQDGAGGLDLFVVELRRLVRVIIVLGRGEGQPLNEQQEDDWQAGSQGRGPVDAAGNIGGRHCQECRAREQRAQRAITSKEPQREAAEEVRKLTQKIQVASCNTSISAGHAPYVPLPHIIPAHSATMSILTRFKDPDRVEVTLRICISLIVTSILTLGDFPTVVPESQRVVISSVTAAFTMVLPTLLFSVGAVIFPGCVILSECCNVCYRLTIHLSVHIPG